MQKYVVFGASPNSIRHSNKAVKSLLRYNKDVVPVGFRKGSIAGKEIKTGLPAIENVGTVLLYVGKKRQPEFINYLLSLKPQKIVFNPGTENSDFQERAASEGIEVIVGCALVMINSRQL